MSLVSILRTVAPVLADLLPGPLGGAVRKVIAEAVGKPGATESDIEKELANASPELFLKLKDAQDAFLLAWKQKGIDLEKLAADDRANARAMQVSTKSKTPPVISAVVVIGWIFLTGYLMVGNIPIANREIVVQAVGTASGALMLVLSFYFGSSSSSQKKDETINNLSG